MVSSERPRGLARRSVLLGGLAVLAGSGAAAVFIGRDRDEPAPFPHLTMATGPSGAVFREIGAALGEELRTTMPGTEVEILDTNASNENLRLIADDQADIGTCSLDAIPAHVPGVSALCRLYDSYLHLIVPAESSVTEPADLQGLRVSFGADDSGTEYTAARFSEVTGIEMERVMLDQADSADALATGEIDAMFSLTGVPTPAIADLAARRALRAVDLGTAADAMVDANPDVYYPATLAATAYEGIAASPTFTVPNLLVARSGLPDQVAETVTGTVFDSAPRLADSRPEAAQINVRTGIATGTVPMHPGARRWFREQKI